MTRNKEKKKKSNGVTKRKDAEKATVWFAYKKLGAVRHVKSIQTQYQRVDIFSTDVASKDKTGAVTYIQTTAGKDQAVFARRKKLEKVPWHESERVLLAQLKQRQQIVNARKKEWFFKIWEYKLNNDGNREWVLWDEPISVPKEWFKAYKSEEND